MPHLNITAKAYNILLRTRAAKQTDKVLSSGDVRIEVTAEKLDNIKFLAMGRKPNRTVTSGVIYYLAHHQGILTDQEYKSTWGNP